MEGIEHIYPFALAAKKPVVLRTRTDRRGYIELQAVENGPVFLFRGTLSAAECESAIEADKADFHLAAAVGQNACLKMEDSLGDVTVFSVGKGVGFLKVVSFPKC